MHVFSLLTSVVIHVVSKRKHFSAVCGSLFRIGSRWLSNKNSNNQKIESARGTMGRGKRPARFIFFLPASLRHKEESAEERVGVVI